MQFVLIWCLALTSLFQISFGSRISEIHTKTSSEFLSGMGSTGSISVDICSIVDVQFGGQDIQCCQVRFIKC